MSCAGVGFGVGVRCARTHLVGVRCARSRRDRSCCAGLACDHDRCVRSRCEGAECAHSCRVRDRCADACFFHGRCVGFCPVVSFAFLRRSNACVAAAAVHMRVKICCTDRRPYTRLSSVFQPLSHAHACSMLLYQYGQCGVEFPGELGKGSRANEAAGLPHRQYKIFTDMARGVRPFDRADALR